jgi:hypothetical protein
MLETRRAPGAEPKRARNGGERSIPIPQSDHWTGSSEALVEKYKNPVDGYSCHVACDTGRRTCLVAAL